MAEVLGEMIVGNAVGGKLCEGRFWMEVVVKLVDLVRDDATGPGRGARASSSTTSDRGGTAGSDEVRRSRSRPGWNGAGVRLVFWQLLQHLYSFFLVLRFVAIALSSCSSLPPRTPEETSASSTSGPQAPSAREFPATSCPPPASTRAASQDRPRPSRHRGSRRRGRPGARPILRMRIWSCLSNVAHLTRRMPWLEGALKLVRHGLVYGPGGVADTDGIVDRYDALSYPSPTVAPPTVVSSPLSLPMSPPLQLSLNSRADGGKIQRRS